jgi:hypothetical protein
MAFGQSGEQCPLRPGALPQATVKMAFGQKIGTLFIGRPLNVPACRRLTMTGMYNVLEKLRAGEELTAKERAFTSKGWFRCCGRFTTTWMPRWPMPMAGRAI